MEEDVIEEEEAEEAEHLNSGTEKSKLKSMSLLIILY